MKIIDTAQAMPPSGHFVLAWLEGSKIPMRALWADKFSLGVSSEQDPEWGEYCEEKDEYFCPAGWYEMNQHEESHWRVDGNVVAWCELPRLDAGAAPAAAAPRARDLLGIVRTAQAEARRLINGEDSGSDLAQTKLDLPETLRVLEHALSQPAAVAGSALDVTLDEEQAGLLRDMLGDPAEYEEALTVRLIVCDGHSGHGLYVAQAEYQDEGAVLLASLPAPAAPALEAPAAPAAPKREVTDGTRTLLEDCISAIRDYAGSRPEDGESWESWFEAAFDLCQSRVRRVFDDHALAAAPQAPAAPSADERAAYIEFLTGKFPRSYGKEEAGRWWDQGHVSALAWQAARTATAAPAAPAVDATDSARLDFMLKNDAFIAWTERDGTILQCQLLTQDEDEHYHVISGEHRFFNTPREAIDAARAAQAKEGGEA